VGEVLNVYEVGVGVKQFTEKKGSCILVWKLERSY